jgi:hypothetical protein
MFFSSFISSWFLSRCRRFLLKKQKFQSVQTFHQITSKHDIQEIKYTLKMQDKNRALVVESFIRSIFFNSRRRSRARFFQNEWTFKAVTCKTLYMSDQAFYMWNLLYINKSNVERSSFTVVDYVKFMKKSRSWTCKTDEKNFFLNTIFCFPESTLRLSDVKTASRLAHIGLAYHASWGMRVAYLRSGGAGLGNREPEYWGKKKT